MITGENIFIVWSYVGVTAAIAGLVGFALWDARRVAARLRSLEERGIRRRSAGR